MASSAPRAPSELLATLRQYRSAITGVVWMSVVLNVLTLAGSIYMMLVYDLILPSRSVSSLLGLLVMITVVYCFQAVFDLLRSRTLSHIGASLDVDLDGRVHRLVSAMALRGRSAAESQQPTRDIDQIRAFLASSGPTALIDLPWVIFFIAVLCFFHIWLGVTTLVGALVMVALTVLTDRKSGEPARAATMLSAQRNAATDTARRHAEEIRALGMAGRTETQWVTVNRAYLAAQQRLSDISGGYGGFARIFRMLLQSMILTVGALLVISDKASGGVIFASSILGARALAPIDQSISNWKNFIAARQSWSRLDTLLAQLPQPDEVLALPAPKTSFAAEHLTLVPPGSQRPTVVDADFTLKAGDAVSIIGPSASGKSSLARGLVGVWPAVQGKIRLDGAALDQWSPDALGRHIGYLPQNVTLLDGTVAQNIARFEEDAADDRIIAAATAAGVHDLILRLPQGYETPVGADGTSLSAGQRQRVALARALYGDPFFVVLDEPNSNLDAEGELALVEAIRGVRARGGIVIVIAHRPGVLDAVDLVLFMQDGRVRAFGPKAEVLQRLMPPRPNIVPVPTQAKA